MPSALVASAAARPTSTWRSRRPRSRSAWSARNRWNSSAPTTSTNALRLATGIQVEEVSTNRTQYLARGFEIKNTQIDGIGLPNGWGIVTNAMDTFGYEKLEVIRGANGLLTGVGNASGTINYVRKRPTNEAQGHLGVSGGSWDRRRVEADYLDAVQRCGHLGRPHGGRDRGERLVPARLRDRPHISFTA